MNERSTEPRPDPARDQQTGRLLDEWLRDEAPTHEPPVLMPTVRARIALTRRRPALLIRDWWRWRPGRNDRRFLRMNTATQLAAVAVLALSGLGLYMVADGGPTTDPAPPAAVTTLDPEEVIAKVTGSMTGSPGPDTVEIGQYAFEHRGMTATGLVIADDPRFDGQVEMAFEWDDFLPQAAFGAATKSIHHPRRDRGGRLGWPPPRHPLPGGDIWPLPHRRPAHRIGGVRGFVHIPVPRWRLPVLRGPDLPGRHARVAHTPTDGDPSVLNGEGSFVCATSAD